MTELGLVEVAGATRRRRSASPSSHGDASLGGLSGVRPRVLWADDDVGVNRFGERLLSLDGFDVTTVVDVDAAMLAGLQGSHAAMVLDQRLPGGEDLAVLRRMRAQAVFMPVVVLTGFGSPSSAIDALSLGVVDYQLKPAIGLRLLAALRTGLRMGSCRPVVRPPLLTCHTLVSLALLSVLFNLHHADEDQLRLQLGWAVADDLSFVELVSAVEALRVFLVDPPLPQEVSRQQTQSLLTRGLTTAPSMLSKEVQAFVELMTTDGQRVRHLRTEALARETGVPLPHLSRVVHRELGVTPDRCRLIAYLQPALRELAHSTEQVAQIGYRVGQSLPSGFDNVFARLWGIPPTEYRELLMGSAR